ncbi:hypothetical protein B484DRAFT_465138 [Ochromonadaceae sp. CCMP2298]|nr:hypothetical protein B484DRAFT_465138 [Ochromonadaceae sp. CCMP2298]
MAALDKSIKDISKFEIRDIIDATENQLVHLQRSQTELLDALRETPDDVDFLEAVEENKGAIRRKSETVETMKNYLKEIDYAYYVEHYRKASAVTSCSRSLYARQPTGALRWAVDEPGLCKLVQGDVTNNLQTSLKDADVATIHSGKWHLTNSLSWTDYNQAVAASGFTDAAAVYQGNMNANLAFSHNMEWCTAQAIASIDAAVALSQPFFLHFATTTIHDPPSIIDASNSFSVRATPAGTLSADPQPGMPSRASVFNRLPGASSDRRIGSVWTVDSLGALIAHLEAIKELSNTVIIVTMDHGTEKRSLAENGVLDLL